MGYLGRSHPCCAVTTTSNAIGIECDIMAKSSRQVSWTTVGDTLVLMSVPRYHRLLTRDHLPAGFPPHADRPQLNNYTPFSSNMTHQLGHLLPCFLMHLTTLAYLGFVIHRFYTPSSAGWDCLALAKRRVVEAAVAGRMGGWCW